ncbi:MAG: rhodanese-like domain-containing protein [Melioribacteraceae bacterium]|nr:rhodanese-like domain-containing protein [Melioribacteraceae bacterium]
MKTKNLLYLLMLVAFLFTACSKDEDKNPIEPTPTVNEAEVLVQYLEQTGDFVNTAAPAMISATDVYNNILTDKSQYIIDIRAAADFAAGHIEGAVNVAAADLVTHYASNNLGSYEKVVIACYTGQTAGWGTTILRVLGHNNVFDLKFGMCSWNQAFASRWQNSIGNGKAADMVTTPTNKNAAGELPELNTGATEGADILEARIAALLQEGFSPATISNATLYTNLSNYYIVNYWSPEHYATGHIEGAVQYTPKETLKLAADLKTLPTDKPVVVYCYTGQTSAHVAAYLRLLGYDAKSLLFGMNAMSYDNMPGTKFTSADVKDYPFVQ